MRMPPLTEIHVWYIDADAAARDGLPAPDCLSPGESSRIAGFTSELKRRRLTRIYAARRSILAEYLETKPESLVFLRNGQGKPLLQNSSGLFHNLSYSHGLAALAVAGCEGIGIDVEKILPLSGREQVAAHHFSESEIRQLNRIPMEKKDLSFYACWTKKEAVIKADGRGLSMNLKGFSVSVSDASLAVTHCDGRPWRVTALTPPDGWAGAVAAESDFPIKTHFFLTHRRTQAYFT